MKKMKNKVFSYFDYLHYNAVTWIIRKTIGLNERAAGVFDANISAKQVVGLTSEIRPIPNAQIGGIGHIEDLPLFENLSVELEQCKPLCDFEDNQNELEGS